MFFHRDTKKRDSIYMDMIMTHIFWVLINKQIKKQRNGEKDYS